MTGKVIYHLSDVHWGNEDSAALDWVRSEVERERPDALLITGDLTMRARPHEFAAALKWINALPAPVAVSVGNHDLPGYHLPLRYLDPYRRFARFEEAVCNKPDWPDLAIIPLNTSPPAQWRLNWSKGHVSEQSLANCLAQIDALPEATGVLVASHHPLRESGTQGTALTRGGSEALQQLARRKIAGVLSGHVHDPFDIVEETLNGPVRMVGAGTLSERLRSTPPGFNVLKWEDGALDVSARTFLSPENLAV